LSIPATRIVAGQRRKVSLVIEARHGVVGLRLQENRRNPALGLGAQLRHPAPVQEVGDQPGDEHGLARARKTGDPQPDHRLAQRLGHGGNAILDAPGQPAGQTAKTQRLAPCAPPC